MKYIPVAFFLFIAFAAEAYNPVVIEAEVPYEEIVIPMDAEAQNQSYLGVLDGFPHLYEFELPEKTLLQVKTKQPVEENANPVNLIVLMVNPETNGIGEIVRMNTPVSERTENHNSQLAISTYDSDWLETELEPGLYRLEVSTPVNRGSYELDFGVESADNNYFGMFGAISTVQQHFGYSWTQYLKSTYLLYQIGIILLIGGIYYTWQRQRRSKEEIKETNDVT